MTTTRVVGECFFWYRLTRVFPDKFHRAVKRLCVCVCVGKLIMGRASDLEKAAQIVTKVFYLENSHRRVTVREKVRQIKTY